MQEHVRTNSSFELFDAQDYQMEQVPTILLREAQDKQFLSDPYKYDCDCLVLPNDIIGMPNARAHFLTFIHCLISHHKTILSL